MSSRRFFAYCVVAAWLALTPVAIKTAMDWSAQYTFTEIAYQDPNNAPGFDRRVVEAYRVQQLKRTEFWWEAGIWAGLTLIGAALLAEPRHRALAFEARERELSISSSHSESNHVPDFRRP